MLQTDKDLGLARRIYPSQNGVMAAHPGDDIRHRRKVLGLDQKTLARLAGVNAETVARIEARSNTRLGTIAKITAALDAAEAAKTAGPVPAQIDECTLTDEERFVLHWFRSLDAVIRPHIFGWIREAMKQDAAQHRKEDGP